MQPVIRPRYGTALLIFLPLALFALLVELGLLIPRPEDTQQQQQNLILNYLLLPYGCSLYETQQTIFLHPPKTNINGYISRICLIDDIVSTLVRKGKGSSLARLSCGYY